MEANLANWALLLRHDNVPITVNLDAAFYIMANDAGKGTVIGIGGAHDEYVLVRDDLDKVLALARMSD